MSTQVFEPAAPVLEPPPAPAVGRRPRRLAVAALALALTSGTAGGLAVAALDGPATTTGGTDAAINPGNSGGPLVAQLVAGER